MKKLLLFICLLLSVAAIGQTIQPKANPPRLVNDFAGVLAPDQKDALERKLIAYDDSTSTQIAIIIIDTTNGYDVQEIALKYLRDWGVGNKNNNGVVILSSIKDRKIRIETGYGMEGVLPDITAQQIINYEIVPNFRAGNYYRGFDEATTAIIKAAAGEYKAPEGYNKKGKGKPGSFIVLIIIILLIAFLGGGGSRGGGMMSRRGFSPWIFGPMTGGGWSGGGGGGWSGGGGGGFGGFGGGSGGGGGASGSW